jgi:nitrogen regulatory protein P-II 1
MIPSIRRSSVVYAIIKAGAGGVTIAETRGKGAGTRPLVGGARGTARYIAEYNRTDTITAIVEDSLVDTVVAAVIDVAKTGSKGDGKIFVSNIEQAYDLTTGQKEA